MLRLGSLLFACLTITVTSSAVCPSPIKEGGKCVNTFDCVNNGVYFGQFANIISADISGSYMSCWYDPLAKDHICQRQHSLLGNDTCFTSEQCPSATSCINDVCSYSQKANRTCHIPLDPVLGYQDPCSGSLQCLSKFLNETCTQSTDTTCECRAPYEPGTECNNGNACNNGDPAVVSTCQASIDPKAPSRCTRFQPIGYACDDKYLKCLSGAECKHKTCVSSVTNVDCEFIPCVTGLACDAHTVAKTYTCRPLSIVNTLCRADKNDCNNATVACYQQACRLLNSLDTSAPPPVPIHSLCATGLRYDQVSLTCKDPANIICKDNSDCLIENGVGFCDCPTAKCVALTATTLKCYKKDDGSGGQESANTARENMCCLYNTLKDSQIHGFFDPAGFSFYCERPTNDSWKKIMIGSILGSLAAIILIPTILYLFGKPKPKVYIPLQSENTAAGTQIGHSYHTL